MVWGFRASSLGTRASMPTPRPLWASLVRDQYPEPTFDHRHLIVQQAAAWSNQNLTIPPNATLPCRSAFTSILTAGKISATLQSAVPRGLRRAPDKLRLQRQAQRSDHRGEAAGAAQPLPVPRQVGRGERRERGSRGGVCRAGHRARFHGKKNRLHRCRHSFSHVHTPSQISDSNTENDKHTGLR